MTSRLKAAGGGSKLARPVPLGTGMKSPLGRGIARPPAEREGPLHPVLVLQGDNRNEPPSSKQILKTL